VVAAAVAVEAAPVAMLPPLEGQLRPH
jgi:hypothetical protein